jgi:uncharacterized protein (DUF4415 family)
MTRAEQDSKAARDGRRPASRNSRPVSAAVKLAGGRQSRSRSGTSRTSTSRASTSVTAAARGALKKKPRRLSIVNSANDSKRSALTMANPEIYRPLKRPVTLRLDADVLAWFKKDGRRYQTRINQALRQVVEREMKSRRNQA